MPGAVLSAFQVFSDEIPFVISTFQLGKLEALGCYITFIGHIASKRQWDSHCLSDM